MMAMSGPRCYTAAVFSGRKSHPANSQSDATVAKWSRLRSRGFASFAGVIVHPRNGPRTSANQRQSFPLTLHWIVS
jgi:hypothetical protein